MGGAAAITCSQRGNTIDHDIKASVALDPAYCVGCERTINVPIFYATGTEDALVSPDYVKTVYEKTPNPPKIFANMVNATHFTPNMPNGPWNPYVAQWFGCYLRDDETSCDYIYDSTNSESLCNAYEFQECILDP
jgi:hypothetical protein